MQTKGTTTHARPATPTSEERARAARDDVANAIRSLEHAIHLARALQGRLATDDTYAEAVATAGITKRLQERAWDVRYNLEPEELEDDLNAYATSTR